jgi:uncharacterized SAM-binding protein YcdF (DUF218 family)
MLADERAAGESPPAGRDARSRRRVRRLRWSVAAALALVLVAFATASARLFVWPDLPPVPARVDAIIELGGPGHRDEPAVRLAREHRAPVLIQSTVEKEALTGICLPPIPGVTILCFHAEPNTTRGEAEYIGRMASERHWHSIVLVTTPDQAWRAQLRVSRCFAGDIYVATTPLPTLLWFRQLPYQWAATMKALFIQRSC